MRANPEWVKELEIMVSTKVGAAGCAALRAVGCSAGCGVWALLCCGLWDVGCVARRLVGCGLCCAAGCGVRAVLCCGLWMCCAAACGVCCELCCGMCCGLCQGCAALSAVLQAVLWGEAVCCPVCPPPQSAVPSLPAPRLPAFPPACLQVKAEIQALSSFGFQYLSQQYLPLKLQEGDWI